MDNLMMINLLVFYTIYCILTTVLFLELFSSERSRLKLKVFLICTNPVIPIFILIVYIIFYTFNFNTILAKNRHDKKTKEKIKLDKEKIKLDTVSEFISKSRANTSCK